MPVLTAVRDVAIILLAVQSLVIGVLLIILLLQIRSLTRLLRDEVRPILASAQETMGTVRGTTTIVSEYVVSPVARVASLVAGVRQGLETLFGGGRHTSGA
ncbi:MAG: hypothetical protein QME94_16490 [Anaerolineae bacterium]|nr:hypothetical protein [Anaerolineae bacterium]